VFCYLAANLMVAVMLVVLRLPLLLLLLPHAGPGAHS
jgi:hypothetical protein